MAIKKWDKNLRPREKAINNGIESLSDYELLALILRCGNKEKDAIELVDGKLSPKEGGINKTVVNEEPKVGRNDPCPCGSGLKYKNCHGKNA